MSAGPFPATVLHAGPIAARQVALVTLACGTLALGILFHDEVSAAVHVWSQSTAFSHCFAVLPIAAWLAWERRSALAGMAPRPLPWIALAALPVGAVWLVAEQVGLMEGRQLAVIALVQVLALAVLGWRMWQAMAAPLLYLVFLVPFGAFLTPALQSFTAGFITAGLDVAGVPYIVNQTVIEIPEGAFFVAEACAGLRFLIASIAFGVLFALTFYRSPWRRVAFITVSIVVPVIANGVRALGLVLLGHAMGSARAAVVDHILYGWLFFSLVTLLLIAAGLPFREDVGTIPRPPARPSFAPILWPALAAGLATVLLAAATPVAAHFLDRRAAAAVQQDSAAAGYLLGLIAPGAGCLALDAPPGPAARRFACGPTTLTVRIQCFPQRASPAQLVAASSEVAEASDEAESGPVAPQLPGWTIAWAQGTGQFVAQALWIDGKLRGTGLSARLLQAKVALLGGDRPPVLLTLTVQPIAAGQGRTDPVIAFMAAQQAFTDAMAQPARDWTVVRSDK